MYNYPKCEFIKKKNYKINALKKNNIPLYFNRKLY